MSRRLLTAVVLVLLAGCSHNSPTGPSTGGGSYGGGGSAGGGSAGGGSTGGSTGGGSYGGGSTGGSTGGTATGGTAGGGTAGGGTAPLTAAVIVGNIFFKSGHNGSVNPAVDTVAVGGTVTWTWTNTGNVPHSVESLASPSFLSSAVQTGDGSRYQVTFTTPGTYRYDCAVHGSLMAGTIVVR